MPILPYVGDDESHLEEVVQATKDHGGRFIMAGGLTMDGVQADRTLQAANKFDPNMETRIRELYQWHTDGKPQYSPPQAYNARLGLSVRELCDRHGLLDRMPRYITPGPLAVNKRIAELLFLRTYDLELEGRTQYQIWAYRKAAWRVDELQQSVADIYRERGEAGLQELPGIGGILSAQIARWLEE